MNWCHPGVAARLRGLGHDVVEVLARQEGAVGTAADLALLIAADAATTTVERIGFPAQPEDTAREMGEVASVRACPQLQEVVEQMARSSTWLIAQGHMVLGQGQRFGLLDEDARESLPRHWKGPGSRCARPSVRTRWPR